MDRNQATGLILISLLLIVYFQFFAPSTPPAEQVVESQQDSIVQKQPFEETQTTIQVAPQSIQGSDAASISRLNQKYGPFANVATGESREVKIENQDFEVTFDTKGGIIKRVLLKEFTTYDKEPLILLDENSSKTALYAIINNQRVNLQELYYESTQRKTNDTTRLIFTARSVDGKVFKQIYSIAASGYQIGYDIELSGMQDIISGGDFSFEWQNNMKPFEKDISASRMKSTINYYTTDDKFDDLSERSADLEEEQISKPIKWISMKQHFFNASIIAEENFKSGYLKTQADVLDETIEKSGQANLVIAAESLRDGKASFNFYLGPNNYQILKKVTPGFDKNIYLGWTPVNIINKYLISPIFNFLENYISNYGIIIMILVLVVRVILLPLSYKSQVSMAKTKVLKPELDEIKKKVGGDMQKVQAEQMKLYKQVGVNPLSGCIPLVLQMPVLFAMFYFFPNSIELRQEGFLWADDLSTYDSVIDFSFTIPMYGDHVSLFTLLMTLSTILYTWSNNQMTTVQGPMKTMTYMMPVVFMFVLNSFPAALSFYYFVSNIVSFGQQALIRRFVDEEKIKKILDENRLKNKGKKKSKFQLKLELAMKASQESRKKRVK